MRTLNESDYNLFKHLLSLRQNVLLKTMKSFLEKNYKTESVVSTKDYLYAIGDIPIALVAHLDTVFSKPPEEIYYDRQKNVLWSPEGLGADDRAGVFAIIKIIREGLRPHIIFTTDEEKGALGAAALVKSIPNPFAEMKYIIQLDRRGDCDCVFYNCFNEKFIDYIEQFGFIENFGSFSDISEICPIWKIAGVNLSIGYQNEHSIAETLHINSFLATINKVTIMLKMAKDAPTFEYIPDQRYYKNWDMLKWAEDWYSCSKCKRSFSEYELFPVKKKKKEYCFYCPDCIVENVHWCSSCGEAFEVLNKDDVVCEECKEKV